MVEERLGPMRMDRKRHRRPELARDGSKRVTMLGIRSDSATMAWNGEELLETRSESVAGDPKGCRVSRGAAQTDIGGSETASAAEIGTRWVKMVSMLGIRSDSATMVLNG